MHDLTAFQRDILFVVGGLGQPKGVDVKAELEAYYGNDINPGRLYPNLDELVEKGLIGKGRKDDRTNEYSLTDRGRAEVDSRRRWSRGQLEGLAGSE